MWLLVVSAIKAWDRSAQPAKRLYKGLTRLDLDDQGCPRLEQQPSSTPVDPAHDSPAPHASPASHATQVSKPLPCWYYFSPLTDLSELSGAHMCRLPQRHGFPVLALLLLLALFHDRLLMIKVICSCCHPCRQMAAAYQECLRAGYAFPPMSYSPIDHQ